MPGLTKLKIEEYQNLSVTLSVSLSVTQPLVKDVPSICHCRDPRGPKNPKQVLMCKTGFDKYKAANQQIQISAMTNTSGPTGTGHL